MKLPFFGSRSRSSLKVNDLIEDADDLMYAHDLEGRLTWVNAAAGRVWGYDRSELLGKLMADFLVNSCKSWPSDAVQTLRSGRHKVSDVKLLTKDNRQLTLEVLAQLIYQFGKPVGVLGVGRDIAERAKLEQQQLYRAGHDELTGLLNRRRFDEELQQECARANREGLESALLFLDLDHFKDVNDTVGHAAGDELLRTVGHMLREGLREADTAARQGGDEFAFILHSCSLEEAQQTADRILASLRKHEFQVGGQSFKISGSIGIALIPRDGRTPAELLSNADLAMYRAKETGREKHAAFSEETELHEKLEASMGLRRQISDAIASKSLRLFAQPLLHLERNEITQYEVLVRMIDKSNRSIRADTFIRAAERFGMIREIDRWVIREAIHLGAACERAGQPTVLAINLSGKSFGDANMLRLIRETLAEASVDPQRFVFEVTESAAIENIDEATAFSAELREIGCKFALDDFGAGLSSFQQLKSLEVDLIKIDGSFIQDLPRNEVDRHLVRAITEMAAALGKESVAEYVSDEETLTLLRELGVDYAQGFYIGEPGDASATIMLNGLREPAEPGSADQAA